MPRGKLHIRTILVVLLTGILLFGATGVTASPTPSINGGAITVDNIAKDSTSKKETKQKRAKDIKASRKRDKTTPPLMINGLTIGQRLAVKSGSRGATTDSTTHATDSLSIADSTGVKQKLATDSLANKRLASADSTTIDTLSRSYRRSMREHFSVTRDTMRAGRMTMYSIIAPGFGQVYNRQYWKLPIIYAGIGGFVAGGLIFNNQYQDLKDSYQKSIDLGLPQETQQAAKAKMMQMGTSRTLMFALAGATYLYSVADAAFNYRGNIDPIRKATTLAAVFPGMGFVYTQTYWRLPIYYGGFIALATVIDYNGRSYERYKAAYDAMTDGNPSTTDEFNGRYNPELLARVRNAYRRDRDLAIIGMAAVYMLSILDTYVISSLKNWDVSDDLALRIEPTVIDTRFNAKDLNSAPTGYGLALKLRF